MAVYGVKEFVGLSVTNFDLNYLRAGKINGPKFFWDYLCQKVIFQKNIFLAGGRYSLGRGPKKQPFVQVHLNQQYFFCRARAPKTVFLNFLASTLMNPKMFETLATTAVFVIPFVHQKQPFS